MRVQAMKAMRVNGNRLALAVKDTTTDKLDLSVYDQNLALLYTTDMHSKQTLIGANDKFIFCYTGKKSTPTPVLIYNWSLDLVIIFSSIILNIIN